MSKKFGRKSPLKRKPSNAERERAEFDPHKYRADPDLSDIATGFSESDQDWSADLEELFAEKFKEQSPTSKLHRSFRHVGLSESNLMKTPKLSTLGGRTIGLTPEERRRKTASRRGLAYPDPSVTSRPRSRSPMRSPKRRERSVSRSPKKK